MKRILLVIGIILILSGISHASPFLVCDPQPQWSGTGSGVQFYTVILDGVEYREEPEDLGDGTVRLKFDLGGVDIGNHQTEVKAGNIWGESASVPFDFIRELPASPMNMGLEP